MTIKFLGAMMLGSLVWCLFQGAARPERYLESFLDSWLDHLRHDERVTQSDWALQDRARVFHRGASPPAVRHFIAPAR